MRSLRAAALISLLSLSISGFAAGFESQVVAPGSSPSPSQGKPGEGVNPRKSPWSGIGTTTTGTGTTSVGTTKPVKTPEQAEAEKQESDALKEAMGQMMNVVSGAMGGGGGSPEFASPGDSGGYSSGGSVSNPSSASQLSGGQQIVGPFQRWFAYCTGDTGLGQCRFQNMGIMGDASHRARKSCHNSGQAIDVGALTCGGRTIPTTSDEYFKLAICMASQTQNQLEVIFYRTSGPNMMQKSDHKDHMHVQIKNCAMVTG